ncbi:MAG: hypothetical protein JXR83_03595 [Deltaproteobacteria bacterium]|nr:hypothetical protein [Deltaproteobacteria bacterium]
MTTKHCIVVFCVALIACDGANRSEPPPPPVTPADTRPPKTDIVSAIASSHDVDSDQDGIPDDVELAFGTDPDDRDTDHDALPDLAEFLGGADDRVADRNGDGVLAPLQQDDDGNGVVDGDEVDSDGDGISNYLEYYGFTYSWMSDSYAPWDGHDLSTDYFKTDPMQRSTDQDPFDDGVEVSGVNMDVSVHAPGNLPMVPAYPDIVVRLQGYAVTLKEQITWERNRSLASGTSWERGAETSHSTTDESHWEVGASATMNFGVELGGSVTVSANYGQSSQATSSSSTSVSAGGSILSEQSWSMATTTDPTEAAYLKLYLKAYNRGTATASNVVPTLALKIGGHNIATFEPGGAQINLLEPGGVYPSAPGVYWTVNAVGSGAPLTLTLDELRALENGAPVTVTVTQLTAAVMQRDRDGTYRSLGDWNEYMARIRAVSALLVLDPGDGNVIHRMVYAGDSVSAPIIYLRDALVWLAGGHADEVTAMPTIEVVDPDTGLPRELSLDGWKIAVDGATFRANGFGEAVPLPAGYDAASLRLVPGAVIVIKAPPGAEDQGPRISYAYFDPMSEAVTAVVSDYQGIAAVEFVDRDGAARAMQEDVAGSSFYVYYPATDQGAYPDGYTFSGQEKVRVTNVAGQSAELLFAEVYTPQIPDPPQFRSVAVDLASGRLNVVVTSELSLDAAPAFLRAYYDGALVCEFERVYNFYQNPDHWTCQLPSAWSLVADIELVAYAQPGVYATYVTTTADADPYTGGTVTLQQRNQHSSPACGGAYISPDPGTEVRIDATHMDPLAVDGAETGTVATLTGSYVASSSWNTRLFTTADVWVRFSNPRNDSPQYPLQMHFASSAVDLGIDGGGVDFSHLTRGEIANAMTSAVEWQLDLAENHVFAYRTSAGLYGKAKVQTISRVDQCSGGGVRADHFVTFQFVTYD